MLLRDEPRPVPKQLNWFNPEPTFARDVTDWKPGEPLAVGGDALSHPAPAGKVKPGSYYVQAVMDRDLGGISFAASDGNVYSVAKKIDLDSIRIEAPGGSYGYGSEGGYGGYTSEPQPAPDAEAAPESEPAPAPSPAEQPGGGRY